ncbi:hypothetical protein AX16_010692 [Volvariella volvacea WC 439]|nr:hypothetical protein AX16_010692 [Volvariella volvacea WC 439]
MSALYAPPPIPQSVLPAQPAYINPSQMQSSQSGPSSDSVQQQKKKSTQGAKRKRSDATDDSQSQQDPSAQQKKPRDGPKKKKANRACFHCQKAHLTCDDSRPCQRCIKRGIANNCTEGHRKKAKYLLDDDELEALRLAKAGGENSKSTTATTTTVTATTAHSDPPQQTPSSTVPTSDQFVAAAESMLGAESFDSTYPFGSAAANLEYSILSAILGNPSPPDSATSPPGASYSHWPSESAIDFTQSPRLGYASSFPDSAISLQTSDASLTTSPSSSAHYLSYPYQARDELSELAFPPPNYQSPRSQPTALHPLQPRYPLDQRPRSPPISSADSSKDDSTVTSQGLLSPPASNDSPASPTASVADPPATRPARSALQAINERVIAPYDYTEGYHFLMKHLPTRFEKNDILRIVRALAIFRPSLIALQMPLSLDDEIFVEKCFQRSLLELDKLISYSGTPTVVWRRTGEICLVAPEFCMLTEWPMEDLVGRKRYIYELFENQSVVEYWENFATHAFENTTQSVYSHCVLLKPSGAPVPSTFCFSIRRDLFDLPSMVIGQWLPLL